MDGWHTGSMIIKCPECNVVLSRQRDSNDSILGCEVCSRWFLVVTSHIEVCTLPSGAVVSLQNEEVKP